MVKQKIVLKVVIGCKTTAMMRAVAKLEGIDEMTLDVEGSKLTVIGTVDPVCIVKELRKIKVDVSIESVNTYKPPEPEKPKKPDPPPCPKPCKLVPCHCGKCPPPCPPPCKSVPCHCGKCPPPCPPPCRSVPCYCGRCSPWPRPCRSVPCHCGTCPPPFQPFCPPPCRSVPCHCGTCLSGHGWEDPGWCTFM